MIYLPARLIYRPILLLIVFQIRVHWKKKITRSILFCHERFCIVTWLFLFYEKPVKSWIMMYIWCYGRRFMTEINDYSFIATVVTTLYLWDSENYNLISSRKFMVCQNVVPLGKTAKCGSQKIELVKESASYAFALFPDVPWCSLTAFRPKRFQCNSNQNYAKSLFEKGAYLERELARRKTNNMCLNFTSPFSRRLTLGDSARHI